jgi:hypothetical protein
MVIRPEAGEAPQVFDRTRKRCSTCRVLSKNSDDFFSSSRLERFLKNLDKEKGGKADL